MVLKPIAYILLIAACRHQPQRPSQRLRIRPKLRQRPNL
jgi:hypothetical protein